MAYRWRNPLEWLKFKVENNWNPYTLKVELLAIAEKLDFDTLTNMYHGDMDTDGYFDEIK